MPEYQLQIKQVVDYPRCRIYREFIHKLINDRSIRINGGSGLFHFTVLCSYANFRTSYRRIDGISYTVSPGEWVCTVKELSCWFRTRFHRQALSMLDTLQKQHLISYTLLGRGNVVKYKILHWARHNSALEYNAPCQKDTGFFFLPVSVALELVSSARCSEMDIILDLWISAVYNDTQVQGSEVGPVAYLNLLITITASNEEDLEWKVSEMKKLLLSQDMNACTCHFREEQAFLSALPLVAMEKKLYERGKRNLLTGGAASCYPFTSYEMCDDNGILLGVNKYNSSLIIVDIFNSAVYKNANMSILGTSGAGKTFTMQLMALRMRRKNIPIFIVAPLKGHEFHRACSNVGGSFIQISPASPHCINVMEIRRVDRSVNELLDGPGIQLSELAAKIQQLHIFFSLLIPDMSHEERQLLDEALVRTYNTKGITHDNASLEDPAQPGQYREMPVLGDLYEILKTSKETMRMAHILNRLVNGSASTFNKQTNVRLDNKYTVLDISSLTGDLLTVGMFVALDFVWDRAKADRTEEKAIFIDECWQLLSGAGAAGVRLAGDFLLEIAKTIRGYGGASIFASQDLADFFDLDGGRFGKGIINNSKTKIILNLEDDEAQRVQEALHLSDAETMEITHFERGHGLISTNNNNIMVEFKASPLEKDLITTDRRELREIVERKRREQSTSAEQQI